MSANLQISTRVRRIIHYIEDIEKGVIQIPAFQRDFIWDNKDKLDFFDSIKKGYPIGSILFWKPEKEPFEAVKHIGPYLMPQKSENYYYILDGFQRLSTIFGCLINPEKTNLEVDMDKWAKEFQICYDLEKEDFFIPRSRKLEPFQVPIYNLIDTRSTFSFQRKLSEMQFDEDTIANYMDRYEKLGSTLIDYQIPSIDIIGGEIEEAVVIFSRFNSKGADISPDWMVSALSYSREKGFRLASVIDNLTEELRVYNFYNIKRELIVQCIINSFGKVFFDQSKKIEELAQRQDFISVTNKTVESIKKAVQFLFEQLLVIDSKLVPYNNQFIFITDFFNSIEQPTDDQLKELKRWFWVTTYSSYFTIYSLSKQREAYNHFQKFLRNEVKDSVYNDKPEVPFQAADFPNKIYFGSVRAKSLVLFLLNYSNNFKNVDFKAIEGLNLSYLFYDIKDENGNFLPESVVPIINMNGHNILKAKDVSYLVGSEWKDEYNRYFLTKEMNELFDSYDRILGGNRDNRYKLEILSIRKRLITNSERAFVKDLGIKY